MRDSTVLALLLLVTLGTATDGKSYIVTLRAIYQGKGSYSILWLLIVALKLNVQNVTCSSVIISWTPKDNRTAHFTILYNSTVHGGAVNYMQDAPSPHTTKLTNLVADTEYTITAIDDDSMTVSDTITAKTEAGTPSNKGILDQQAIVHCTYPKNTKSSINIILHYVATISTTSIGSTSVSFKVKETESSAEYDCWVDRSDHRLHRWMKRSSTTTVAGLNPGTYYNITCQKRLMSGQQCQIAHRVVTTSKY